MKKLITLSTPESTANTATALRKAFETNGFEFMLVNSFIETVKRNGTDSCRECKIFGICWPNQTGKGLDLNISATMPCVLSLCREDGKTVLSAIEPTASTLMAETPKEQLVAKKIEEMIFKIIEEALTPVPAEPKSSSRPIALSLCQRSPKVHHLRSLESAPPPGRK